MREDLKEIPEICFWLLVALLGFTVPMKIGFYLKDGSSTILPTPSPNQPFRNPNTGLFKQVEVKGKGQYSNTVIFSTERGEIEVQAPMLIGSQWENVIINHKGRVVRRTLTKGAYGTACLEAVIVIRRTGEVRVGNQRILAPDGKSNGSYALEECKK